MARVEQRTEVTEMVLKDADAFECLPFLGPKAKTAIANSLHSVLYRTYHEDNNVVRTMVVVREEIEDDIPSREVHVFCRVERKEFARVEKGDLS